MIHMCLGLMVYNSGHGDWFIDVTNQSQARELDYYWDNRKGWILLLVYLCMPEKIIGPFGAGVTCHCV